MTKRSAKKKSTGINEKFFRILRYMLYVFGIFFALMLILAVTTIPFYAWYNLGVKKSGTINNPKYIILLGGNSIPSENGLLRTYYTSLLSEKFPNARVVVAIPGNLNDPDDAPRLIEKELMKRFTPGQPVLLINKGGNTREQVLEIIKKINTKEAVTLVTSPEHMYRAVLTFKKAGFTNISGLPTFEQSLSESSIIFNDNDLKGNKVMPPIGKNLQVRYQFWHHLKLEIIVIREYFAITYYKLRGWI
jgi:uncharacterized SAM-binding protein YcdF (DUF218 family)